MASRPEGRARSPGYVLSFGLTAVILAGITLVLVLVVLPRRYVLSAGLQESGVSFPSEAAPFVPPEERMTEAAPLPPPPPEPVQGPAEIFWASVEPLLESGEYALALPLFEEYLQNHPEDWGVRREYAITLQRAGRPGEAVLVFDKLLSDRNDPGVRLLLARALRDRGRLEEASTQYQILLNRSPDDSELALEWGQALAWARDYQESADVLSRALARDSSAVDLRVALAQVYYWSGELDAADRLLSALDEETLRLAGGAPLHRDIVVALTPPEPEPGEVTDSVRTLTPEEKIALARAEEDYETAAALYREVLREAPQDTAAWEAYADVLQFGLEDLEGSREALLSVEALGVRDPALQFRLAQLEIWTGRENEAYGRLRSLLRSLESSRPAPGVESRQPAAEVESQAVVLAEAEVAEVQALLGDLDRWRGDRFESGTRYAEALEADSTNPRALSGMAELEEAASAEIQDVEAPGVGGDAYALADSDEFARVDLGVQGKTINDHWVWAFKTGRRWFGGYDLTGGDENNQGLFLELESGRWWRWGTIRTGIHLGMEEIVPGETDLSFGASLHFSDLGGFRTDLRYHHGPAYPLTVTLQSVYGSVVQDRISANLARSLGARWSLSLTGDAARLHTQDLKDGSSFPSSLRFEAGASLGRAVTDDLMLGVNARGVHYSEASPVLDDLRLFWDPQGVLAGGLYAQWDRGLAEQLAMRARVNPSMAFINERRNGGFQLVPHLSAELGLSHQGSRFRTSLDGFYYQGRFDGYRAYGLRLSVSVRDWFRKEDEE